MRLTPGDEQAIAQHTRALLRRADVTGQFPTPVDHIVASAGLTEPADSMFSASVIDQAPEYLRRAVRRLKGPLKGLLDRRAQEVHINPRISNVGHASFIKLHESTHHILPWQQDLAYADDAGTLSPSYHARQEQEANIGASNLLFQHEAFDDLSRQYKTCFASILELADIVGASYHATFRRYVRAHDGVTAGAVLDLSPCSRMPLGYGRHEVIVSDGWTKQFGGAYWPSVLYAQPYSFIESADQARVSPRSVRTEFFFPNLRNDTVRLSVELFSNQHHILVLIWKPRRELLRRSRVIAA